MVLKFVFVSVGLVRAFEGTVYTLILQEWNIELSLSHTLFFFKFQLKYS